MSELKLAAPFAEVLASAKFIVTSPEEPPPVKLVPAVTPVISPAVKAALKVAIVVASKASILLNVAVPPLSEIISVPAIWKLFPAYRLIP